MTASGLKRIVPLAAFFLLLSVGCDEARDSAASTAAQIEIQKIPFPDLERLEPASQKQIEEMYERVQALEESNPNSQLLAKAYGELGKLFNSHKLNEGAAISYRNAEMLAPEDYRWTYYRAHLFRKAGEPAIAIRGLQRAIELMKRDVSVEPQQFVAALTWLGNLHQGNSDYTSARLMYEQAIKVHSETVVAKVALAQVDAAEGNHATAVESLEAIRSGLADDSPAQNTLRYQLAMSYRALGDSERARALLEGAGAGGGLAVSDPLLQAMRNSAISSGSLVRDADDARKRNRFDMAIKLYRKALEIDPQNYFAHVNLANVLQRTGDSAQALWHLERATELQPQSPQVWGALGRHLHRQGQIERAVAALETALQLQPDDTPLKLAYARIELTNLDRPADALIHYEQVLELEPANPQALAGRAAALRQTAGCEASRVALEVAYERVPTNHILADGLARTLLVCGESDQISRALALAQQAFDTAATSPRYADTVARAHAAAGDFPAAIRQQEQAIELATKARLDAQELQWVLGEYRQGRPWRQVRKTSAETLPPETEE